MLASSCALWMNLNRKYCSFSVRSTVFIVSRKVAYYSKFRWLDICRFYLIRFFKRGRNIAKTISFVTCLSVCPSVRMEQLGSHGNCFMKFGIWERFQNLSRNFKFHYTMKRITGTLHEDLCTFIIISRSFLLRIRNISEKRCRENQNTSFIIFNNFFLIWCFLWDNVEKYCRPDYNITRSMLYT